MVYKFFLISILSISPVLAFFISLLFLALSVFIQIPKFNTNAKFSIYLLIISLSLLMSSRSVGAAEYDDLSYWYYPMYLSFTVQGFEGLYSYIEPGISSIEFLVPSYLYVLSLLPITLSPNGLVFVLTLSASLLFYKFLLHYTLNRTNNNTAFFIVSLLLPSWGGASQIVRQFFSNIFFFGYVITNRKAYGFLSVFSHTSGLYYLFTYKLIQLVPKKLIPIVTLIATIVTATLLNNMNYFDSVDKVQYYLESDLVSGFDALNYQMLPLVILMILISLVALYSKNQRGVDTSLSKHSFFLLMVNIVTINYPNMMYRLDSLYITLLNGFFLSKFNFIKCVKNIFFVCIIALITYKYVTKFFAPPESFGLLSAYGGYGLPFYYIIALYE